MLALYSCRCFSYATPWTIGPVRLRISLFYASVVLTIKLPKRILLFENIDALTLTNED